MDKIILSGVALDVHIGVPVVERSRAQELILDVELGCYTRTAGGSDNFHDTVDYSAVHHTVKRVACERAWALVEALAESIAAAILTEFPVAAVRVLVRKPAALRDRGVAWAGVEIVRERHG
jgi:7,8-dihydroneopterin aldolase/epimerase/oxygenase